MSLVRYIELMPKVETFLQLEGAFARNSLLHIAEQNDIPFTLKHYKQWTALVDKPDYNRLDDLIQTTAQWIQTPDDLARLVYELGVALAKQNIRYAEVGVSPALYVEQGFTFEQFLNAINDGRSRAERAWKVGMRWVLNIRRTQVRTSEDVLRWVSSAAAKRGGVVGLGVAGREIGPEEDIVERTFRTAQKKGIGRAPQIETLSSAEEAAQVIDVFGPDRLLVGTKLAQAPEAMRLLADAQIPVSVCMPRAVHLNQIANISAFPLRKMYDDGLAVSLSSGLANLYHTSLNAEYKAAAEIHDFSAREIESMVLNGVRGTLLPDDEKATMTADFKRQFAQIRAELGIADD
jgi:adenosine deaminase